MKRYKVEDKRLLEPKPTMFITLAKGPYTKKRILNKTGWLTKNAIITECVMYNNLIDGSDDAIIVGPQRDEDGDLIVG